MNVVALSGISRNAGGLFYAVSSLSKELLASGINLSVYGRHDPFVAEDVSTWNPVPVVPYPSFGPLSSSGQLRRRLAEKPAELLHLHGLWLDDQWAALQWQKKNKAPVIISPHGMLDPWAVKNAAWKKKLVGALFANESLRRATCIHALCQSEADSIRAYGLKTPIAIIPNGVELPKVEVTDLKLQTPNQKKKLLFLGRIHPKKGLKELLSGWAKAQSLKPKALSNWQLLIAGWDDGNHLAGLKQQASQLGLSWSEEASSSDPRSLTSALRPQSSDLCFLGPHFGREKEVLLRNMDAFILPSFSEGLPMSVLEAWAYNLPVVMTEFCNLPSGFDAGAALRIEPNAESIAQGLAELASRSMDDLTTMGSKGRRLVEEKFTWDKIARDMKAVYEWCLGGNKPEGVPVERVS